MAERTPEDPVEDDELLYRSVPVGRRWVKEVDGKCKASSQAFNDVDNEPSVDRAFFLGNDPVNAKMSETDGILELLAREVRQITVIRTEKEAGKPEEKFALAVDVVPKPLPKRPAHALVKFHPIAGGTSNFSKLKERLAFLAHWAPNAEINPCE